MREVEEAIKATVLRSFVAREAELAEAATNDNRPRRWRWGNGVVLFPEGICPWCRATIRSNRIWHIQGLQLLGQWKAGDGRLDREAPFHPHVNGTEICTGGTGDGPAALFLHMNPSSTYHFGVDFNAWKDWLLEVWDHDCPGHTTHISEVDCGAVGCRVRWWSGTPGCDCGCGCHPELQRRGCRCASRHENCRCPRPDPSAPTLPPPEEGVCSECGYEFGEFDDDDNEVVRSRCCQNMCERCHDRRY